MKIQPQDNLPEVLAIAPDVAADKRGFFMEAWAKSRYEKAGLPGTWVQDNFSRSGHGVLRGLHFQHPHEQGKLVWVLEGEVFDVAVDVRVGSPTFGKWVSMKLSAKDRSQLYIPPGFAHGFCVTSESVLLAYKCTDYYHPESEVGIAFDDPDLAIPWPVEPPQLSERDRVHPRLKDLQESRLPVYSPVAGVTALGSKRSA